MLDRRHFALALRLALGFVLTACGNSKSAMEKTFTPSNPFANASPLLYQAPPFDKIHNDDYQPAIEEGMRSADRRGRQDRGGLRGADVRQHDRRPREDRPAAHARELRVPGAHAGEHERHAAEAADRDRAEARGAPDAIHLNAALFARIKALYDRRATLKLDSVQAFLVERYYKDFVRAGALLADADKTKLRALNEEESKLSTDFQNHLLAATKAGGARHFRQGESWPA